MELSLNTFGRLARAPLVAAALSSLLLAGCWGRDLDKYMESARGYLDKGDAPAAVLELMNAIVVSPEAPEVRFLLGTAMRRAGDAIGAEVELRKAVELGFDAEEVRPELAAALFDAGAYAKALKEAEAPSAKPQYGATLAAIRGDALLATGKQADAAAAYASALAKDPTNERARLGQIRLSMTASQNDKAQIALSAVLKANPKSAEGWMLQASLSGAQSDRDGMRNALEKAIEANPHSIRPYIGLIPILVQAGKLDDAAKRLTEMKRIGPKSPATAYADALIAYHRGDKELARNAIRAVLKSVPSDDRARLLGGAVEHDLGNHALAVKLLEAVLAGNPQQAYARRLLASSYMRMGKNDKARETLAPLVKTGGDDLATMLLAGQVALASQEPQAALDQAQKILGKEATHYQALLLAARAKNALGRTDDAVPLLERAIEADPKQSGADIALVEMLLAQRKPDLARKAAERLSGRLPDRAESMQALGLALRASGDKAGARAALEKALTASPSFLPAARELAAILIADGDTPGATTVLKKLVDQDPGRPEAVLLLVAALSRTSAPVADVMAVLDSAIKANNSAAELHLAKIDFLLTRGDLIGARDAALAGETAAPDDPRITYALARAQNSAGEPRQALITYGKLISSMPQSALPHLGRADAYSADKNWKEAKASADRAIALAPQDPSGYLSRVQILLNTAEYGPARDEARAIQKKWPAVASGYLYEAKALVAAKDLEGADRVLRAGIAATGDAGLLLALYDRLAAGNQSDQANREVDAWMSRHPNDARVLVGAGELRQRRGDWRGAADWYRRAAKLQPKNAVVLNNLAWALGKLGDKSALEIAGQALALSPNEPAVLDTAGSLNVEFGNVKEGITLLESAVARSPFDAAIRINLIRGLVKEKRTLDATRQIQAAMPFARTEAAKQELEKLQSSL